MRRTDSRVDKPPGAPKEREELKESEKRSDDIKKGYILYTWNHDLQQNKIPYWIIPDSMVENNPLVVEKVLQATGLMEPHLILRFSRVYQPLQRWHNFWCACVCEQSCARHLCNCPELHIPAHFNVRHYRDFDESGDQIVDERELPFALPPGMTRDKAEVAEYLSSLAQDRVNNILSGVCSACHQAGAWIELGCFDDQDTPYGLVDHAGPLLWKAKEKQSVLFSTYCLEERSKVLLIEICRLAM